MSQQIEGHCAGCGKPIPMGQLYTVTKWSIAMRGTQPYHKHEEIYCRGCKNDVPASGGHKKKHKEAVQVEETQELTPKEIAIALYKVMPKDEAYGSKKLAKLAGIEYSDLILPILHKLKDAGKCEFTEEGKWQRL
jgi:hypothetical protein